MQVGDRVPRGAWGRRVRSLLSVLLALEIGTGCALFRKEEPVPPPFRRIALRTQVEVNDDGYVAGDLHGDTTVKRMAIGGGQGGLVVGAYGFWVGTGVCTSIFFVYPLCLAAFTIAGAVVGGAVGVVAGGPTGLPWNAAKEVNETLADFQHKRNFTKEFRAEVKAAMPAEKQVNEHRAQAIVTARLEEVDLRQHLRQRMSLRIRASMTQEWERGSEDPPTRTCEYVYTSPIYDVEDWLLWDGKAFHDHFSEGIRVIARWMARDLRAFSTRKAQPKTAEEPATCFQVPD